jgi:predicted nucleic acid-binding protein
MATAVILVETSVWARRSHALVGGEVMKILVAGTGATCHPVMLELLYSARSVDEFRDLRNELEALSVLPIGPAQWRRALDVYEELAAEGGAHQRSVSHPDLLTAAAAEAAGAEVLHYDEEFDRIAAVTGQPTRWIAERGSLG